MERILGKIIAFLVLILVSWKGYKKYNRPGLWIGFVPLFSIIHTIMGWYILTLAFHFDSKPDQFPLFASILMPTYAGVSLFGFTLEAGGLPDDIAYSIAFGFNAILVAVIIALAVQWVLKRRFRKDA